jgi:hypothetical protein
LAEGSLQSCNIVVNDRCFEAVARSRWKFWKPRRSWLQQLGQR